MVQIVSLQRTKTGTWKGRKTIPADVRDTYAKLYGQRWEAIQTLPAELSPGEAKAAHAECHRRPDFQVKTPV